MTDKRNELLETVIQRKPVEFKAVFESILKEKVTKAVELIKQDLHKDAFNKKA
jgi:hypothetical protein